MEEADGGVKMPLSILRINIGKGQWSVMGAVKHAEGNIRVSDSYSDTGIHKVFRKRVPNIRVIFYEPL